MVANQKDQDKTPSKVQPVKVLESDLAFEEAFYEALADTPFFEVLPLPDDKGYYATQEEREYLKEHSHKKGYRLLYRVSLGKNAVVMSWDGKRMGIMPENNPHGFEC